MNYSTLISISNRSFFYMREAKLTYSYRCQNVGVSDVQGIFLEGGGFGGGGHGEAVDELRERIELRHGGDFALFAALLTAARRQILRGGEVGVLNTVAILLNNSEGS